jgi:glycosyltransferase involved in cell wall biosynthesis
MFNKKKICFLIPGFAGGGAEKQCIYLLNELQKDSDLEVTLIYFFEGVNFYLLNAGNIKIFKIETDSLYDYKNILKISNIIKQVKSEVLFSWLHSCDIYSFFIKLRFPRIKWIMAERDSSYPILNPRYLLRIFVGRYADLIISNSEEGLKYWQRKFVPTKKLRVIPNILLPFKDVRPANIKGDPIIIYAGRLEKQKNVFKLTHLLCELSNCYPNGFFYIIGDGTLKDELNKFIIDKNKISKVVILPFQKDIGSYFCTSNLYITLSNHEGLPNALIENISMGNKVVVSDIPEHRKILGKDYPYFITKNLKIEEGCSLIIAALNDRDYEKKIEFAKRIISLMTPELITNLYKNQFLNV